MTTVEVSTLQHGLSLVGPAERALNEALRILKAGAADHEGAIEAVDSARLAYHQACVGLFGFVQGIVAQAVLADQQSAATPGDTVMLNIEVDSGVTIQRAREEIASSAAMIRDNTDELKRVVDAMYINGYLMSLQEHGLVSLHVLEQLRVERDRAFAVSVEARD
ncbi:hypothetical protein SAMN05444506_12228 [Pseudomonas syringae]|uniref:Uncharacterized protein n=1 Tax=Pseudomonas syringae pv. apii TaxID=81036 RepID=A0A3M3MZW0_9PSED|nr:MULTISPECIES: hypothetical protein [Pseudomonas syringae group]RMN43606.1 hypothetical protein ALQ59_02343 [Pseudomonas syringae pv. apii]RMN52831.1 hypothetical protein ALQ58_200054 [Pseudomonas syringae pv. apii]RMN98529.1 hypothetical protein ALQ49_00370 [Pseudomonas syringae pv. apii]SDZ49408.1 hypothetical protein SAMN05444506_12228 [Pseudomonas syringae]